MKYPKSKGGLWVNNRKTSENHPDMRGHINVSNEQIHMLIAMSKAGLEAKLQLGAWNRVSEAGSEYVYIEGETYMKEAEPQQQSQYVAPQVAAPRRPQAAPAPVVDDFEDDIPF